MSAKTYDLHGVRVFECAAEGTPLRSSGDAVAVIGDAMAQGARLTIIPVARLDPGFFQLRTGLAGEMAQKFVNYRQRLAIVGDTAALASRSATLRDFIYETNRGGALWFLATLDEVAERLARDASETQ
jgi:hypothetical protein